VKVIPYDAEVGPTEWAHFARATLAARLRMPIAEVHPLAKASKAHARLEKAHVVGRIALAIR
jgi:Zinc-binding dehydrogenase